MKSSRASRPVSSYCQIYIAYVFVQKEVVYLVDNLCSSRHFRKESGQDKCSRSQEDLATYCHVGQGTIRTGIFGSRPGRGQE